MKKLFLLLTLCVTVLIGCSSNTASWQEKYDLGVRYLSEGNYTEAIIAFTAAIEIDEKNVAAYLGRAESYIASGETEENLSFALKDYEKVVALDETVSAAYLGMADVYIRQGEYDKALEILKNVPDGAKNDEVNAKIAELESGSVSDSSGKMRKMSTYDADGSLIWYHEYAYDEKGMQNAVRHCEADGTHIETIDILYDENGNMIQGYYYVSGGVLGRMTFEYDTNGLKLKECYYDEVTDELWEYTSNEFNNQGQLVKSLRFDSNNEMLYYLLYEYNNTGDFVKESQYCPKYDWDSGVFEEDSFELIRYCISEYNDIGKRVKYSSFLSNGECEWYWIDEYDDSGKLIRTTEYNGDGTLNREVKYN